jgi:hypothetical protein
VPRKSSSPKPASKVSVVTYNVGPATYQIDPERHKVYRRFVEIETSKAFEIYSSWRAQNAQV